MDLDFDDASGEPAAAPSMPPRSPGKDEYPVEAQGDNWLSNYLTTCSVLGSASLLAVMNWLQVQA